MAENLNGAASPAGEGLDAMADLLREQAQRQGRLRHVQQFLRSPLFIDLRDQPIQVTDPPEVIEERKRDLDYRIRVLESLVSLLIQERDLLDRAQSVSADPVSSPDGQAHDADG